MRLRVEEVAHCTATSLYRTVNNWHYSHSPVRVCRTYRGRHIENVDSSTPTGETLPGIVFKASFSILPGLFKNLFWFLFCSFDNQITDTRSNMSSNVMFATQKFVSCGPPACGSHGYIYFGLQTNIVTLITRNKINTQLCILNQ